MLQNFSEVFLDYVYAERKILQAWAAKSTELISTKWTVHSCYFVLYCSINIQIRSADIFNGNFVQLNDLI
jgi:hypothetical protein